MNKQRRDKRSTLGVVSLRRREVIALAAAVLVCVVIHGASAVIGFGESDAARLAVQALEWHETGSLQGYAYSFRTSPLYLHLIKFALGQGVGGDSIPALLNWMSIVLASLLIIPFYLLARLLSDRRAAAVACVLLAATPAHWLAGIYGMAHAPALFFLLTSVVLFVLALETPGRGILQMAAALVTACIALGLKADLVLGGTFYVGLAYYLGRTDRFNLLSSLALPAVALAAPILHTEVITAGIGGITSASSVWSDRFPFTATALYDAANLQVLARTAGYVIGALTLATLGFALSRRAQRRTALVCLTCAMPPILFWGLRLGNSARHMLLPCTVLLIVAGLVLSRSLRRHVVLWPVLAGVLVANYFISPASGSSVTPPSHLDRLTLISRAYADMRHTAGRAYSRADIPRKMYVGSSTGPYVTWEHLLRSSSFRVASLDPVVYQLQTKTGRTVFYRVDDVMAPARAGPSDQWFIFSAESGIDAFNTESRAAEMMILQQEIRRSVAERRYIWVAPEHRKDDK